MRFYTALIEVDDELGFKRNVRIKVRGGENGMSAMRDESAERELITLTMATDTLNELIKTDIANA
jgi:hypothetical protein